VSDQEHHTSIGDRITNGVLGTLLAGAGLIFGIPLIRQGSWLTGTVILVTGIGVSIPFLQALFTGRFPLTVEDEDEEAAV
jgi:hypothetical protein